MKQNQVLTDFSRGELSRFFSGRFDLPIYGQGVAEMTNAIPIMPAGFTYRPGFHHVGSLKGTGRVFLFPFIISESLAYDLEFGPTYLRFWKNNTLLLSGGNPLEIATPYTATDLPLLQIVQDAGMLLITCGSGLWPIKALTLIAADSFTFGTLSIVGNAGDLPFQGAGNYPRAIAIHDGCLYAAASLAAPQDIWRSRPFLYGDFTYFDTVTNTSKQLTEPALSFAGTTTNGSATVSGIAAVAIEDMKVGDSISGTGIAAGSKILSIGASSIVLTLNATASGTVTLLKGWAEPTIPEYRTVTTTRDIITEANAIHQTIASDQNDEILWLAAGRDLIVGTRSGERRIPAGTTPANFECRRETAHGSAAIQPYMLNEAIIFVNGDRKGAREYFYQNEQAAYQSPELSYTANEILAGLVREIDYQNNPLPIAWFLLETGILIGCVYSRIYGFAAWFRVTPAGGGVIESIAVTTEAGADVLKVAILRGGVRYLEYLAPLFALNDHLDACTTAVKTAGSITGITWITGAARVVYNGIAYAVTIAAGAAALPAAIPNGSTVLVGLPFTGIVETMPIQAQSRTGTAQLDSKSPGPVKLRVLDSYPAKVGPTKTDPTKLETMKFTGPASQDIAVRVWGTVNTEGRISIILDSSLDFTALVIKASVDAGGQS